jgi:hypothetical protein
LGALARVNMMSGPGMMDLQAASALKLVIDAGS